MNNFSEQQKKRFFNVMVTTLILLAVFIGIKSINALKENSYIGGGVYPTNTITVSATGEMLTVPDIGSFSYTVTEEGKTVKEAQDKAGTKTNAILAALKAANIEDKDIKTVSYNSGPKYEWKQSVCTINYCPPSKNVLVGYETSQSISVKVRKTEQAGDILTKVGELGAANISNLEFVVDDMDAVKAEARDKAITEAKAKAKILSKSLGVKLGKIVSFNENGENPMPYAYGGAANMKVMDQAASVAPQVPVGENKVVSTVSITYEVK